MSTQKLIRSIGNPTDPYLDNQAADNEQTIGTHNNIIQRLEKEDDDCPLSDAVDKLQQQLGGYGCYQMLIFFLLSLVYMRGGWHVWVPIYQGWTPSFHCSASPGLSLNESVPASVDDGTLVYSECKQYVNLTVNNDTEPCHNGWTYLWNSGYTSIVSWMDLVCDHAYQVDLTTTVFMAGMASGTIFLTPLSDRFGSKTVMLICLWVQAVFGTVLIWASNIVVFCILKFLIGMCNMTIGLSTYILVSETLDATHREVPAIALQFSWSLSIMSVALLGYLIPSWKDLELAITLPINLLSLLFIFIIPESLPWLLSKGKVNKAEQVINRFTRFNGLPPVSDLKTKLAIFDRKEKSEERERSSTEDGSSDTVEIYTALSLFKTPRLRFITIIMFYLFLVNSLAYYGIMFSTPELAGDRFVNLCLLGLVEIPAYILCLCSNRLIGRRRSVSIFLFICAVCSLAVLFIPDETGSGTSIAQLKTALVMIGKFGITGSYSAIYLYASEVYPTVIRNQAVGASSFFENVGSIVAPNMVYVENSLNNLPLGIFGGMTIIGCALVLLLPETHNQPLPQTIDDIEEKGEHEQRTGILSYFKM